MVIFSYPQKQLHPAKVCVYVIIIDRSSRYQIAILHTNHDK